MKCVIAGCENETDGALQCPSCREAPRAIESRVQHHANGGTYTMPATPTPQTKSGIYYTRDPAGWTLTVHAPPRTKKNHGRGVAKESAAYVRFCEAVYQTIDELPVKERPILPATLTYNLRAVFYVDPLGESADLFGLLQAIADALQDAGVVEKDWVFRTVDGSRIVAGDARPRCEVTITPLFT